MDDVFFVEKHSPKISKASRDDHRDTRILTSKQHGSIKLGDKHNTRLLFFRSGKVKQTWRIDDNWKSTEFYLWHGDLPDISDISH
jgi:hypothetical protein